ncbi:MAG TPA: VCBS repeat-containing protein [Smithella sp.]|nr:VCBS repeat-containing protein [Smithella sp.]
MRKILQYIFCLTIILLASGSLCAKDKYTVTILPFSVNSAENIDYVKQGIEEMLTSRISSSDKITVTDKSAVLDEMKKSKIKSMSSENALKLGKKLNSDYVVWGSITKIGNSISINGKLTNVAETKSDVGVATQSQTLDDIIPKVNDFSENILKHILGTTPQAQAQGQPSAQPAAPAPAAVTPTTPQAPPALSRESQIIAGMKSGNKKGGTLTAVINSEYVNTPEPINRRDFWMSQRIATEFKGMAIGDVNNDGTNKIVVIDTNTVYIYKKTDKELVLLEKMKGNSYDNYLAVDVADINGDGIPQIIVTSINDSLLDSFVLEYKNGKYVKIASDIRWFLRVIDTSSGTMLLGQEFGTDKPFNTPIYEMVWRDGKYVSDQKMKIPFGLSIYGLAIDNLGIGGGDKIFALDDLDYLYITEKTNKSLARLTSIGFKSDELIWKSDDEYGGSNNYIEKIEDKINPSENDKERNAYLNLRLLTFDYQKGGKKQLIVVKNLSSVGRIFKKYKAFSASEIYDLEWDGLGMAENWHTKKINGYVADYAIKDVDNDGKPEIVLALVQSTGATLSNRSVIVVYKMEPVQ